MACAAPLARFMCAIAGVSGACMILLGAVRQPWQRACCWADLPLRTFSEEDCYDNPQPAFRKTSRENSLLCSVHQVVRFMGPSSCATENPLLCRHPCQCAPQMSIRDKWRRICYNGCAWSELASQVMLLPHIINGHSIIHAMR